MNLKQLLPLPFLALLMLAGCNSNPTASASSQSTVTGRMEGDPSNGAAKTAVATASAQSVLVTAYAINADGSQGAQVGKDSTDAQGNFQIVTTSQGSQNWLLVATQGNIQWMTRFNNTLSLGETDTARPMNMESTLLTRVYLALQGTQAGLTVTSGEIAAAMDARVASANRLLYEGDDSVARILLITHFSAAIIVQSQARNNYLSNAISLYSSDTASATALTRQAEAILNVALYTADEDSTRTSQAEMAYLRAVVSAYGKTDSTALSYARANEAAFHATLMTTLLYTDSTRNAMRRRALRLLATAADTALQLEFARANASQFQLQSVVTAGLVYETAVDTSSSDASRDSVTSRYRAAIRVVFQGQGATSDSSFIAILILSTTTPLSTSLHTLSTSLQTALAADVVNSNALSIGQDLQNYNAQAVNAILLQWQGNAHNSGNADRNSALAQIMAYLSVSSNSSNTGS